MTISGIGFSIIQSFPASKYPTIPTQACRKIMTTVSWIFIGNDDRAAIIQTAPIKMYDIDALFRIATITGGAGLPICIIVANVLSTDSKENMPNPIDNNASIYRTADIILNFFMSTSQIDCQCFPKPPLIATSLFLKSAASGNGAQAGPSGARHQ